MGSGNSKSATQNVFYGETPVRFSNDLVDSLQSSTETNSTREGSLELHVQSRVESELQRLQSRESQILADLEARLAEENKKHVESPEKALGREKVQAEINALRERLGQMPKLAELDKATEKARSEVVNCLRLNSQAPLVCYKEVEEFKNQTRRMERQFVVKTIGREYPS